MIKELNASWKQVKPQSLTDVFCKARLCVCVCVHTHYTYIYMYMVEIRIYMCIYVHV